MTLTVGVILTLESGFCFRDFHSVGEASLFEIYLSADSVTPPETLKLESAAKYLTPMFPSLLFLVVVVLLQRAHNVLNHFVI